jgi:hypothetical protein
MQTREVVRRLAVRSISFVLFIPFFILEKVRPAEKGQPWIGGGLDGRWGD